MSLLRSRPLRSSRPKHEPTAAEREHMARVRKLGCDVCGRQAEAHHPTGAGWALRASHWDVIPLCSGHHREGKYGHCVHKGTKEFEGRYGTQREMLSRTRAKLAAHGWPTGMAQSEADGGYGWPEYGEARKVAEDAAVFGTGVMKDGKHVPLEEVMPEILP